MPTNDERREVAARLRNPAGHKAADEELTLDALGLYRCENIEGYDTYGVMHLADLIDRPTCHICETDHEFEDSVRCDRCQTTFMRPWEPFKYCPECGAVVMDDE